MKSGVITEVHLNFDSSEIYISEAQVPVLSFKFHHLAFYLVEVYFFCF